MTTHPFNPSTDLHPITTMLEPDPNILRCFHQTLSAPTGCIYIAEQEGDAVGVLMFQQEEPKSICPTLFVVPSRRRQGIGTELLQFLDQAMEHEDYEYAQFRIQDGDKAIPFFEKRGYQRNFTCVNMERDHSLIDSKEFTDQAFEQRGIVIRSYTDEDYWAAHTIINVGFYLMRRAACAVQWYDLPSESSRKQWLENGGTSYVVADHGEIVAVCKIVNNEIDLLGVRPDKQRQGYGTLLMGYWINRIILEQGADKIELSVLEGNPAEKLYRKMGFYQEGREHYYIKFFKPDSRPSAPPNYPNVEEIMKALHQNHRLTEEIVP